MKLLLHAHENFNQKNIANKINVNYGIKMSVALGIGMHNVYREGRYTCTCIHVAMHKADSRGEVLG